MELVDLIPYAIAIVWCVLGWVGMILALRLDRAANYTPAKWEYLILVPAWALIGLMGLFFLLYFEYYRGTS